MNVSGLRHKVALKSAVRGSKNDWKLGVSHDFVESTAVAEYLYNFEHSVEGVLIFMRSLTEWECVFLLEAGYLRDAAVSVILTFPPSYPDSPPVVRITAAGLEPLDPPGVVGPPLPEPGSLIHPFAHPKSGVMDLSSLLKWEGNEHCSVHVLVLVKTLLLDPGSPSRLIGTVDGLMNSPAMEELERSPSAAMKRWREKYLGSSPPSGLDAAIEAVAAELDMHVTIMLRRLQSDRSTSMFHLVNERIDVIHQDISAMTRR